MDKHTRSEHPDSLNALLVCAALAVTSTISPPVVALPALFLALAAFSWWSARRVFEGNQSATPRARSLWGLAPSVILFLVGSVSGPMALWCFVAAAGSFWYWILIRYQRKTPDNE